MFESDALAIWTCSLAVYVGCASAHYVACVSAGEPVCRRQYVEVPGALLQDGCWLYAASVLLCKCGLPPYARVVPVDASSHALAM